MIKQNQKSSGIAPQGSIQSKVNSGIQPVRESMGSAKKEFVETGKMSEDLFNMLVMRDPSKNKKYVEWMCRRFIEEGLNYGDLRYLDALKDFDQMCQRNIIKPPDNDIGRYKTVESMVDKVNQNKEVKSSTQIKKDIKVEGAKVLFENDKATLYKILNKDASCLYGSNTKWCTASSDKSNYFNSYYYDRECNLIYVIPKGIYLKKHGKWACASYTKGTREFYNERDEHKSARDFARVAKDLDIPFELKPEERDDYRGSRNY